MSRYVFMNFLRAWILICSLEKIKFHPKSILSSYFVRTYMRIIALNCRGIMIGTLWIVRSKRKQLR